jgi:hypothetical protein
MFRLFRSAASRAVGGRMTYVIMPNKSGVLGNRPTTALWQWVDIGSRTY